MTPSKRSLARFAPALMLLAVVVACTTIILTPHRRADLLPRIAGCYRGDGFYSQVNVVLSDLGVLTAGAVSTPISVEQDKRSVIFVPEKRLFLDHKRSDRIYSDSANPTISRFSSDMLSFTIFDEDGEVAFRRSACSNRTDNSH